MKRITFLFMLSAFLVIIQGTVLAGSYKNDPAGFRDMRWGQDFSTVAEQMKSLAVKDSDTSDIEKFTKNQDNLTIGDAGLKKIVYCFWQGKFIGVRLETDNYHDYLALRAAVNDKFGLGYQQAPFIEHYTWEGTNSNLMLEWTNKGQGVFAMESVELNKQYKQSRKTNYAKTKTTAATGARGSF
ncbi:hypothetical protein [Pectinatus frisingensis]|jgi:hypothetical protein|uniref:hypothetical protein n=1 Tax=Pectinatus frisingensis TaxID=865 RepID=UPI0018C70A54|nr:hypothetical protein [Pectinatus frisingensis]